MKTAENPHGSDAPTQVGEEDRRVHTTNSLTEEFLRSGRGAKPIYVPALKMDLASNDSEVEEK